MVLQSVKVSAGPMQDPCCEHPLAHSCWHAQTPPWYQLPPATPVQVFIVMIQTGLPGQQTLHYCCNDPMMLVHAELVDLHQISCNQL